MKRALQIILSAGPEGNQDAQYTELQKTFQDLFAVTHRDHLWTIEGLSDRRRRAEICLFILPQYRSYFEDAQYQLLINALRRIKLENWSKQLGGKRGMLRNSQLKKELYLNELSSLSGKVLEPREYIGIDLQADSDLDAPSLVTAMTPPGYTQPPHSHGNSMEVTFYAGPSEAIYFDEGKECVVPVQYADIVIIPAGVTHTIRNHTSSAVKNISVKLPSALLDRSNGINQSAGGLIETRSPIIVSPGVCVYDLSGFGLDYSLTIREFSHRDSIQYITASGPTLLYVLSGNFIVEFLPIGNSLQEEPSVLAEGDAIVLGVGDSIRTQSIRNQGSIYSVTLGDESRSQSS